MKVGYIRVSTQEQNLERQEQTMARLGVEKLFSDKASGKDAKRRGLEELMRFVREGDQVVVDSYSRMARNVGDLLNIVSEFEKMGVGFVSIKEQVDTSTPHGKLVLTIFGALYEFERENMLIAQREGIEIAKAKGLYKGREPIAVDEQAFIDVCAKWRAGDITATEAMKRVGLKPNTFYRRVKAMGV